MTTKLAWQETVFLPFDQGIAGPGAPGTAGTGANTKGQWWGTQSVN